MGGKKKDKQLLIQQHRNKRKEQKEEKKKWKKKMYGRAQTFKLSKQYVQYFNLFNKEIFQLKLQLKDVGGDGNCLFRSFADQIDGNQTSHKFMREQAAKFILANKEFFKPFIDEDEEGTVEQYAKMMRKDGEWGGHFQLQALSQCFRNFQEVYIRPITQQPQGGMIHLAYFQHEDFEHYTSIRDYGDDSQNPAIQRLKYLNKNMYGHLLYEDEEEYLIRKQLAEMQIIQKINYQNQEGQQQQEEQKQEQQPFPNYPKNKKCKCGSKENYKNCCYKQYEKRKAQKYQKY